MLLLDLVLDKLLTQQGQGKLAPHKRQNQMLQRLDLVNQQDNPLNRLPHRLLHLSLLMLLV